MTLRIDDENEICDWEKKDPIESDPQFKEILAQADAAAEIELKDASRDLGFCHIFWRTKKRILKERYGVDWKSPSEMNPNIDYD